jgi:hypothetical protein
MSKMLQEYEGSLSFATDAWTSPNHKSYMAVTVHFEQRGVARSMLLDLVEVARSHSGLNLAAAFATVLEEFGISDKARITYCNDQHGHHLPETQILSITCDNASNNDTMIDDLEDLVKGFSGAPNRTRCFAHIINLIAQTIIRQFDIPKDKDGGSADDGRFVDEAAVRELETLATNVDVEELLTRASNSHGDSDADSEDDLEGWVDEQSDLSTWDLRELEDDVRPVRRTLVKVRPEH